MHIHEEIDLGGRVAIVTGGGRGIGRAIALALAQAGAAVSVVARSSDQLAETVALIQDTDGRAAPFSGDVTDPPAVQRIVAEIEKQLGPVDLLVNNAGIKCTPRTHGLDARRAPGPIRFRRQHATAH